MTNGQFQRILKKRLSSIQKVLATKQKHYARGDDRLHNFKRAGAMLDKTPEQALIGMMTKHSISILDMVNDIDNDVLANREAWQEKIGDHINYLILLEALIEERLEN